MSDKKRYGNGVWDSFFELLYPCDDTVTPTEAQAELKRAGIDMRPAYAELQQLIESKKAQDALARARANRTAIVASLNNVVSPKIQNLRGSIEEFIARNFSGQGQVAHFHKLEKASTEEDLQSFLDDLNKLAAITKMKGGNGDTSK
jgi:hypothetical protein